MRVKVLVNVKSFFAKLSSGHNKFDIIQKVKDLKKGEIVYLPDPIAKKLIKKKQAKVIN